MAWVVDEDTNFVVGDSPRVVTLSTGTHPHPIAKGYIACDGPGSITIEVAQVGAAYESSLTLKSDEAIDFKDEVGLIRLTHTGTDSSYRVVAIPEVT